MGWLDTVKGVATGALDAADKLPGAAGLVGDLYDVPGAVNYGLQNPGAYNDPYKGTVTRTPTPAPDPYAKWGGRDAFNQLNAGFENQKSNIYGTARGAADQTANQYRLGILDFLDKQRLSQQGIENRAVQNELARKQGSSGVMDMVGRGVRNAGVMLSGRNASNSTAAGVLARIEGDRGRKALSQVNNQYEMGLRDVNQMQEASNVERASGVRRFEDKESMIGNIVSEARNALGQLDAARLNASLPDRIAIEQEAQNIRNEALGKLAQFDSTLYGGLQGIQAGNTEGRRAEAARLANAGTVADDQFEFTNSQPADLQGTGPFAGDLPLFTFRRRQGV